MTVFQVALFRTDYIPLGEEVIEYTRIVEELGYYNNRTAAEAHRDYSIKRREEDFFKGVEGGTEYTKEIKVKEIKPCSQF
jgi:hypothetical protein